MKPTLQISSNQPKQRGDRSSQRFQRIFPSTDHQYQSPLDTQVRSSAVLSIERPNTFWKMSTEFFNVEMERAHKVELAFFAFISTTAAWQIIMAVVAAVRMVRNY